MPSNQRIREYMLEINSIINILPKNDKNIKITENYETIETEHRCSGSLATTQSDIP